MHSDEFDETLGLLYSDPVTQKLPPFTKRNSVFINPKACIDLLQSLETTRNLQKVAESVEHITKAIEKTPQNSIPFLQWSQNYDLKNQGSNIVDFLIGTYFRSIESKAFELSAKVSQLISTFLTFNNLSNRNLTKIFRENTLGFYNESISSSLLHYSVKLLQEIFSKYTPLVQEPQNFFYFNYTRAGIRVQPPKPLQWPFSNGICLCFWFYLEDYQGPTDKDRILLQKSGFLKFTDPQKLFTIHCTANGGGGIEAYFIGFTLYYRVLPMNYTTPTAGSNGVLLGEYKPKTWYFLGIEHERAKTFGRAFLNIYINQKFIKNYNIEYPKISPELEVSQLCFGDHLFGRISTIMIFNSPIGKKLGDFYSFFNFGIQNSSSLKNLKIVLENLTSKLYLLFIPPRSSLGHCFDLINTNDGTFLENTGSTWKDILKMKMSFSGGMSSILPFFYLLRFCDNAEFPNLLNELLKLLILLFKNKAENQNEALKIGFFQIMGQHLCELNCNFFNHETLELLAELKHIILDQKLNDQLFTEIIWNLDILEHCNDFTTINEYFKFIRTFYIEKPQHYLTLFGVSDILAISLDKFDIKNLTCCENHSLALGLSTEKSSTVTNKNKWKMEDVIKPLLSIVEVIMLNGSEIIPNDFVQILHTFNSKSSPCFIMNLFRLLKTILIDRDEENPAGSKIMMKILQEHNFILTLVYLISTSPCLDIKAMCIKFINFLIIQKTPTINEKELATYISFIMWNLNLAKKTPSPQTDASKKPSITLFEPRQPANPLTRKSCKAPTDENMLMIAEHRGSRSRSVDSGPTAANSKFYQRDLINEKKKSILESAQSKKFEEKLKEKDLEVDSDESSKSIERPEKTEKGNALEGSPKSQKEEEKEENPPIKVDDIFEQDMKNLGTQFLNNDYENIPQAPSMSNKRKSKPMDFGFSGQAPKKPLPEKKPGEGRPRQESLPEKSKDSVFKTSAKSLKPPKKFNLNLREEIIEEGLIASERLQSPKSQPPQMRIQAPKINILDEESNRIQEVIPEKRPSSLKKPGFQKKIKGALMIDTEQINEIYSYGGEKGRKVQVNTDELSEEYREIAELAVLCVRYMRGELKNDDYFANKMPTIKKFDAPQSCRGLKTVSFPDKPVTKPKLNKELTIIRENSMSFDTEINLSSSIDVNKNSVEEHSNSSKREPVAESRLSLFSSEFEVELLDCQPLYTSLMEWVLRRQPSNIDSILSVEDSDRLESPVLLQLVMAFYRNCSYDLKPKILQDLIMLIKWNQGNCNPLIESNDFPLWLVEVLLQQQILLMNPENSKNASTIMDFGTKIMGIMMKHAMNTHNNGTEIVASIVKHLQTISGEKKSSEIEKKV